MNRIIDKFPLAYKIDQTPYTANDFSENTINFCKNYSFTTSDIRSSKVIVIGDLAVGKTSLINCFCRQIFHSNYKATIGVDFDIEQFQIFGVPFHLQIWDTAGQERFKSIAQSYYRFARVIVVVFDLSKINTLKTCENWLKDALNCSSHNPKIFLVGTKKDLLSPASYIEVEKFAIKVAKQMNAEYWCVSSKREINVSKLFFRIAALTFESIIEKKEKERNVSIVDNEVISIKHNKGYEKNKKQCCSI